MKARNGFVSNSSSSSFLIVIPGNKHYRLSKIESALGGYNDCFTDYEKDELSAFFWKQITRPERESYVEPVYGCDLSFDQRKEIRWCSNWIGDFDSDLPSYRCEQCPHFSKTFRKSRNDDYYEVERWRENVKIPYTENDGVYQVQIENCDNDYISYDLANKVEDNIGHVFKDHTHIEESFD